ncbi:Toluene-4-sulfonate monooxygenase system iron-sulfur subunit TsaM1 [Roseovarius albus]|uniref:Toluene-4-sulfonate monooxygenase system iron-sulfur subunit TsaM1 n=1 Tax=Roseovarius albus TaxID=1247867 RepID=A0A1X6ZR79_9RHOB|nr:aromatic ring-hydroxylating dioxygenase subunit alpha [Roseovarius albus]SLN58557.1 Toluene-4-sulfonate monooxygenase system iron-sulfur subunit TsaM1 [Roseovarius albus]
MFLKNAWYVAAWGDEITEDLQKVMLLNESICMFRDSKGKVIALENACPHRKLPLTKGRRKGDAVECGYHGLTFNGTGQCIHAPGQGGIPSNAKVHAYPTEERYGLIWIWMGNPALADTSEIFEIENFDNPAWGMNRGKALEIDCNYLYVTDNLLDPTHVAWVHQSSFGQAATEDTPLRIRKQDDGITVWRWMMDVEPAPFYKKIVEFEGNCDRMQHYEVRYPCHALIRAVFTPAGTGGVGGSLHENTFIMDSYNFMTPETEGRTRYYWFQLRNIRPDDEALSEMMSDDVKHAFEEDREVLNDVQEGMANKTTPHIDLNIDGGQLRFRRQLEVLIDQERTADAALS